MHLEPGVLLPPLRALLRKQRIGLVNARPEVPELIPALIPHPSFHQEMSAGSAGRPQVGTGNQTIYTGQR